MQNDFHSSRIFLSPFWKPTWHNPINKILQLGFKMEVASITLRNAHKENKRAKSECLFAHLFFFCFLNYC